MKRKRQDRKIKKFEKEQRNYISNIIQETHGYVRHLYYIHVDKFFNELGLDENNKIQAYRLCLMFGFIFQNKDQKFYTDMEDTENNPMLNELKQLIPKDKLVFNYTDKDE